MAKRRNWLNLLKRLFGSGAGTKAEKKDKRRRWLFGRLKLKRPPALTAPPSPTEKTLSEAEEEHTQHALAVAIATAAAAEAAVAAAQAAAEVVRLTATPLSVYRSDKRSRELAAIKIQTAFRGYLARKALRALKGLVRLQALIRGRAVRRQAITTLRSLQSIIKIQSQVRARRVRTVEESHSCKDIEQVDKQSEELGDIKTRIEENRQRWDDSLLSKEELEAIYLTKQEAALKRERALEYAFARQERRNAQRPTTSTVKESEPERVNWRWSWLEKWVDAQPCERRLETIHNQPHRLSDAVAHFDCVHRNEGEEPKCRRGLQMHEEYLGSKSPSLARKSFHLPKQNSIRDNESFLSSPAIPSYMASTESAKARERTNSMPKQRTGVLDTHSDPNSSSDYDRLSPSISKVTIKHPSPHQRSPRLKGVTGPVKSERSLKDLSVDSSCSLLNWDRRTAFR
ncbi:protein IQ-DOMAIN 12-like isoform X2 [Magnolia sinica]|nr:protein IQ-DOMAIN 12-like isoform X2 [Magnolia sinica]XP_058107217.1 protein IQ-DOMAIN 12-like isoform X2 [Magnolia sinica]XP_058107218.1 protein IQ-DOMAIN 12-like isoform X2 [Magnolia sinica]